MILHILLDSHPLYDLQGRPCLRDLLFNVCSFWNEALWQKYKIIFYSARMKVCMTASESAFPGFADIELGIVVLIFTSFIYIVDVNESPSFGKMVDYVFC